MSRGTTVTLPTKIWTDADLGTRYIAVPISSAAPAAAKMSPFKTEPTILPKTVHLQNSPVILSSPQRMMTLGSASRAQQYVSSVVQEPSSDSWSGKRFHDYSETFDSKRSKKSDKGGKGLRHFSMKVCEKVQKKGTTSYNEVADELVAEFSAPHQRASPSDQAYDQKNIRRRVYDALNVLMAMNIISKEKKEIKWLGLPTNSAQECQNLEVEKQRRLDRIRVKSQQLQDLIIQQIAFKNLVERNKTYEKQQNVPAANSVIQLPFIIVNTSKKTVIDCSISSDKSEYLFTFDNTFEIHDDIEVLKRMGLALALDKGACSPADLERAKKMVPKALEPYVVHMAKGGGDLPPGMEIGSGQPKAPTSRKYQCAVASTSSADSDAECAMVINETPRLSRQSSVGSSSDLHSRGGTSSASEEEEDFSDSDSDPSQTGD